MLKTFLKVLIATFLMVSATVAGLLIWASTPINSDPIKVDPAVTHLNSLAEDEPYSSKFYEYEGRTLHFVQAGEGETILFLHGFPSHWFSFSKQMEALRQDYRVIAIDGLGTGLSDAPTSTQAYTLDNMSNHIMSLMASEGIETFHVVGHDWGASFAFALAQAYPEKIKTVTGIAAPPVNVLLHNLETEPALQSQFSYIEQFKRANPIILKLSGRDKGLWANTFEPLVIAGFITPADGEVFRNATNNPKRINALISWYRANIPAPADINEESYWPYKNAKISMPAIFIWGDRDRIFASEFIDDTQQIADDLEIMILSDVGHRPHIERAEEVTQAIKSLIKGEN